MSGLSPFQGDTDEETLGNVIGMKYEFNEHYFSLTSPMAKDFIQKLLMKNPEYVIKYNILLGHISLKFNVFLCSVIRDVIVNIKIRTSCQLVPSH